MYIASPLAMMARELSVLPSSQRMKSRSKACNMTVVPYSYVPLPRTLYPASVYRLASAIIVHACGIVAEVPSLFSCVHVAANSNCVVGILDGTEWQGDNQTIIPSKIGGFNASFCVVTVVSVGYFYRLFQSLVVELLRAILVTGSKMSVSATTTLPECLAHWLCILSNLF